MLAKEELLLIIYFTAISLLFLSFVVIFFIAFQKRKNRLLLEKFAVERKYEEELTSSQLEIQEETLKGVGRELHDNIGQLLAVANMQLAVLEPEIPTGKKDNFLELRQIVKNSIQEVRSLSKSLNNETLAFLGLEENVENEIQRLGRMSSVNFHFQKNASGDLQKKDSIIIFRIIQESITNVIKHSEAKNLWVKFEYSPKNLIIDIKDDGNGFVPEEVKTGSGMINMESRAKLIKADFDVFSDKNEGTILRLTYPLTEP